jgi:hypothetical protein
MSAHPIVSIETWERTTAVVLLPRRVDRPTRTFRTSAEALEYADKLRRDHGWPIQDSRR